MVEGQALYLQIPKFADGKPCSYKRFFLIIEITKQYIKVLNATSANGKAHLAFYFENGIYALKESTPPFNEPTLIRIDSAYTIEPFKQLSNAIYNEGQKLNHEEMVIIKDKHRAAAVMKNIPICHCTKQKLQELSKNDHIR